MNETTPDNNPLDLSALDFGPAWARKDGSSKKSYSKKPREHSKEKRSGGKRPPRNKNFKDGKREYRKPRRVFVEAEQGIEAQIMPIEAGVDNLAKEISAAGRTYSVFDLARIVLGSRDRFHIIFNKKEGGPDLLQCVKDEAVFLTKDECLAHAESAEWLTEFYTSEEVEVDPPTGNFQNIAKCGFSGELLGPTNFHGYQEKVQNLHRAKFSNMSLEQYKKRIVSESGDEIVELWRQSMTKRTVYKVVGEEETLLESKAAMLKHLSESAFEKVFRTTHKAMVPSSIDAKKLSPSLLTNLKNVISEQRKYPGVLASFLCRQLTGRQLAVFKWQGKLHAGPSRPHTLPKDLVMADRPQAIYKWICDHVGAGVDELWAAVCPDVEGDKKYEWYHDLHWLINEGFVVFMNNGHLFPSSASKKAPQKAKAKTEKAEKPAETPKAKKEEAPAEKDEEKSSDADSKE